MANRVASTREYHSVRVVHSDSLSKHCAIGCLEFCEVIQLLPLVPIIFSIKLEEVGEDGAFRTVWVCTTINKELAVVVNH